MRTFVCLSFKNMTNQYIRKGLRCLVAVSLAWTAVSCQTPEEERIPQVLEMIPSKTNPHALETSINVKVNCDLHWSVSLEDSSWGSVEVDTVNDGLGGSFTFKLGANTAEEARENTLVLKAGKEELRKTISQGGLGTYFSPRTLELSGTREATVSFPAPSAWTAEVTEGADWLKLKNPSGEKGAAQLTVSATDPNEKVGARTGMIQIAVDGQHLSLPVTQGQKDVILLGSDASQSFSFEAREFSVLTLYNVDYQVQVSVSWIKHVASKDPLHQRTEHFVLEENNSAEARVADILFSSEGHPDALLVLGVTQEGKDPILATSQPGFYGIQGTDYILGANGWNQSSRRSAPEEGVRYRLLNAATLSSVDVSGLPASDSFQKGQRYSVHLTLKKKGKSKLVKDYDVVGFYSQDGLAWYKGESGTYFVVKQ